MLTDAGLKGCVKLDGLLKPSRGGLKSDDDSHYSSLAMDEVTSRRKSSAQNGNNPMKDDVAEAVEGPPPLW